MEQFFKKLVVRMCPPLAIFNQVTSLVRNPTKLLCPVSGK